jgi:nucleoside-diphosphate-sugar epimerase
MGSGLPAQQASRRLDEYGTRTLVVGALGVIGRGVVEHLADSGRSVVGLSRRQPPLAAHAGAEHVLADMTDPGTGVRLRDDLHDVTHLVVAAYQEQPSLAGQVAPNVNLLEGSLDVLASAGAALQHVTLYQGNKYYGAHLDPFKTPARKDDPRLLGPNLYYDQQDLLRRRAERDGFAFTIFRPEAVCGVATGNPMNLLTAIAVYANLCKHKYIPLRFPGPEQAVDVLYQVTDARLLARATAWAGLAENARDQDFNITNGDTFRWRHMFPRLAEYFGIAHAPAQQLRLTDHMPSQERDWEEIASLHRLEPTPFHELAAWGFADFIFHSTWDNVSSTIKIRQAGFPDCIDSEQMFIELFDALAVRNLIPGR